MPNNKQFTNLNRSGKAGKCREISNLRKNVINDLALG